MRTRCKLERRNSIQGKRERMDKRVANADEAIAKLFDGATILVGGFGTTVGYHRSLAHGRH